MLTLIFKDTSIEGLRKQVVDAGAAFINFKIGSGSADVKTAPGLAPKPVELPVAAAAAVEKEIAKAAEPVPVKVPGKRGPKPKTQAQANVETKVEMTPPAASEPSTPLPSAAIEAPPAAVEFTKEDAIKALTAVNEKFGMDKARECLLRFGVNRLGELKPNQFADFVNYCNEEAAKKK